MDIWRQEPQVFHKVGWRASRLPFANMLNRFRFSIYDMNQRLNKVFLRLDAILAKLVFLSGIDLNLTLNVSVEFKYSVTHYW